ncbi:MAG: heme o synthase [Burkholderiales bacterium]|nr:heme o synthase [Burkholderiales bacterium]
MPRQPQTAGAAAAPVPAGERAAASPVRLVFNLFKLRIGLVIAVTALAGMAIQPGAALAGWQVAALFLAVLVSSASAGAFNQYYEVDIDRRMRRTRARPFAAGRLAPGRGWLLLIVAMTAAAVAAAWLAVNPYAALYTFLGAFFYAIVYTVWLKRRTWWNIVIGGLAGSFAVLAGAAAVTPGLSPEALLLALVLFLWTPPHFWSLAIAFRDDYRAARVPMLPVVKGDRVAGRAILAHAVALVALSLALALYSPGWIYLVFAAVGGWLFVKAALRLAAAPGRATAMQCFHASLIQLSLVLLGAMLDAAVRAALG